MRDLRGTGGQTLDGWGLTTGPLSIGGWDVSYARSASAYNSRLKEACLAAIPIVSDVGFGDDEVDTATPIPEGTAFAVVATDDLVQGAKGVVQWTPRGELVKVASVSPSRLRARLAAPIRRSRYGWGTLYCLPRSAVIEDLTVRNLTVSGRDGMTLFLCYGLKLEDVSVTGFERGVEMHLCTDVEAEVWASNALTTTAGLGSAVKLFRCAGGEVRCDGDGGEVRHLVDCATGSVDVRVSGRLGPCRLPADGGEFALGHGCFEEGIELSCSDVSTWVGIGNTSYWSGSKATIHGGNISNVAVHPRSEAVLYDVAGKCLALTTGDVGPSRVSLHGCEFTGSEEWPFDGLSLTGAGGTKPARLQMGTLRVVDSTIRTRAPLDLRNVDGRLELVGSSSILPAPIPSPTCPVTATAS